jgi:hypothetical protein
VSQSGPEPPETSDLPDSSDVPDSSDLAATTEPRPREPADPNDIPVEALWAMKARRHHLAHHDAAAPDAVHGTLGSGDSEVHVIDDGVDHCMIGRVVGASPDGCTYCLVGRITRDDYADLRDAELGVDDCFMPARDIALNGVFREEGVAPNVFLVQHFRTIRAVPTDYLPPGPFLEFTD